VRASELLGPHFDVYCQQRGKRYGIDWKIIYPYPAPTFEKPASQRFYNLTYNMTPKHVKDRDFPDMSLKDGDTVFVVNSNGVAKNDASSIGPKLDLQRIRIQDGETEIWQNPSTNEAWYKIAEKGLADSRSKLAQVQAELEGVKAVQKRQKDVILALKIQNSELHNQISRLHAER
ncbi:hypothetical protein GQ44DRAFT_560560, partial [Phaeosphaeriaceae sp. PMI808]